MKFKQLFDRITEQAKNATTTGIPQALGVVNFNLEPVAKTLYPVITPLRNAIPRFDVSSTGDTGAKWKAITAINPSNTSATLREGRRGGYIDHTEADYSVNYATIGLENFVTEQAIMAAKGFDDALAIAGDSLLRASMIAEEFLDLGGNQNFPLGTAPAPSGTAVTGGGTIAAGTYIAKVVALTLDGYNRAMSAGAVVQTVSRTNGDGTVDVINAGSSITSAASAGATLAATGKITWKVTAVPGAFGYAWFVGTAAGSLAFAGITSTNVFVQTAPATGAQLDGSLVAADYSANPYAYNGLAVYASQGGGAYQSLDGATLTADGSGGVVEIDAFLAAFYISRKVSPTTMWVNAQDKVNLKKKILQGPGGTGASSIHLNTDMANRTLVGGSDVSEYLNSFSPDGGSRPLPIKVHPNLPQGKILFDCDEIPYPLANIPGPRRKILRREYWQVLWPQVTMNRQTGVYYDGALQVYTPFALGILDNIALG